MSTWTADFLARIVVRSLSFGFFGLYYWVGVEFLGMTEVVATGFGVVGALGFLLFDPDKRG